MAKLATADAKAEAIRAMREAAKDMGLTASELADMVRIEREIAALNMDHSRADVSCPTQLTSATRACWHRACFSHGSKASTNGSVRNGRFR